MKNNFKSYTTTTSPKRVICFFFFFSRMTLVQDKNNNRLAPNAWDPNPGSFIRERKRYVG